MRKIIAEILCKFAAPFLDLLKKKTGRPQKDNEKALMWGSFYSGYRCPMGMASL